MRLRYKAALGGFLGGVTSFAILRWAFRRTAKDVSTSPIDWRESVEILANQMSNTICWNVRYTAALYAIRGPFLNVDTTWTYADQRKAKLVLGKWLLLKKRHRCMLKALDELLVTPQTVTLYCQHKQKAQEKGYSAF